MNTYYQYVFLVLLIIAYGGFLLALWRDGFAKPGDNRWVRSAAIMAAFALVDAFAITQL